MDSLESMTFDLYAVPGTKYWFCSTNPLPSGLWVVGYAKIGSPPIINAVSTDRRRKKEQKGYNFIESYNARGLCSGSWIVGHGGDPSGETLMRKIRRVVKQQGGQSEEERTPLRKSDEPKVIVNELPAREESFFSW